MSEQVGETGGGEECMVKSTGGEGGGSTLSTVHMGEQRGRERRGVG